MKWNKVNDIGGNNNFNNDNNNDNNNNNNNNNNNSNNDNVIEIVLIWPDLSSWKVVRGHSKSQVVLKRKSHKA